MINLCFFPIIVGGEVFPAANPALKFEPRLTGEGPVKNLVGFDQLTEIPVVPVGSSVIIPRFAAAVAWAAEQGLVALTVPLSQMGQRGAGGAVTLASAADLEPGPAWLAFDFVEPTDSTPALSVVNTQRMVGGTHPILASHVGTFAPEPGAISHPDGTATLPPLRDGVRAVIVPQDGAIIRAAETDFPGVILLVTGTVDPVTKEVALYRVR